MTHPVPASNAPRLSRNGRSIPPNGLRALFPLAARPGMTNLASGHPPSEATDAEGLGGAMTLAAKDPGAFRYGPTVGDMDLREAFASTHGDPVDGIVVTSGAQQGIDLAVRALCDPGDTVLVPEAVYPAVLSVLAASGVRAEAFAELRTPDDVTALDERLRSDMHLRSRDGSLVRAIYLTPTFANPTGATIDLPTREALVDCAARHHIVLIEDDPYGDLWFAAPPPASLLHIARARGVPDCVLACRSASKTVAPGLRVGWLVVPEPMRRVVTAIKGATDLQANSLSQRVLLHYLRSDRLGGHLVRVRELYAGRARSLLDGIERVGVPDSLEGGMFAWVRLHDDVDPDRLFDEAVARDVLFAPGGAFAASDDASRGAAHERIERFVRLCFVAVGEERLTDAADRLGEAAEASRGPAASRGPIDGQRCAI